MGREGFSGEVTAASRSLGEGESKCSAIWGQTQQAQDMLRPPDGNMIVSEEDQDSQ